MLNSKLNQQYSSEKQQEQALSAFNPNQSSSNNTSFENQSSNTNTNNPTNNKGDKKS